MKSHLRLTLLVIIMVLLLTACATFDSFSQTTTGASTAATPNYIPSPDGESYKGYELMDSTYDFDDESLPEQASIPLYADIPSSPDQKEMIIYTSYANLETLEFDSTIESLYTIIERYNAFIESSDISGLSLESRDAHSYRYASFSIRVPVENYQSFSDQLPFIGNLLSISSSAQNVSSQYTDLQSRLDMYRVEEERLLELFDIADSIDDMLVIEQRLSDLRYNIESISRTINDLQNNVIYSTFHIYISEVNYLSENSPITKSFSQELSDSFVSSLYALIDVFKFAAIALLAILPFLLLFALITAIILLLFRVLSKRRRKAHPTFPPHPPLNDDSSHNSSP